MNKPIDQEEQRFAQMLKIVEPDVSPADQAFLDQLKARTTEAFRAASDNHPGSQLQPQPISIRTRLVAPFRSHAVRRLALAASIVIAAVAGFAWWSTHHAGIAFAQVVATIERITSCTFTLTMQSDQGSTTRKVMLADHHMRMDLDDSTVVIDLDAGKGLTLMTKIHKAVLFGMEGMPEEYREYWLNWLATLKQQLAGAKSADELGHRQIAGRDAIGFQVISDFEPTSVWVDAHSGELLEARIAHRGMDTILLSDFDLQPQFDPSLFDLHLPDGYILLPVNFNLNLQDLSEQDLLNFLDLWTRASDGYFPDSLTFSGEQSKEIIRALHEEAGLLATLNAPQTMARGAMFLKHCIDRHYVGTDVQRGQTDKPVFWYQPKGSDLYHVIYGDLSVRQMSKEQLPAEPPAPATRPVATLLQSTPASGSIDIDPGNQVRLTFDQDMRRRGQIILQGGPDNGYLPIKVKWIDRRTCVVPVTLKPNGTYWLMLNPWDRSLYSGAGAALKPVTIEFATGPGPGQDALTPEQNTLAVEKLRTALLRDYVQTLGRFDLDGQISRFTPVFSGCKTPSGFALRLRDMLADLPQRRITFLFGNQQISLPASRSPLNVSWDLLPQVVPGWRQADSHGSVYTGQFEPGIGYINLRNWWAPAESSGPTLAVFGHKIMGGGASGTSNELKSAAVEALTHMSNVKSLIIDIRGLGQTNGLEYAQALAGCFIEQPVVYAREVARDAPDGQPKEHRLEPNATARHFSGRVIVLTSSGNGGTSEAFALMMKQVSGCTLMGSRMAGIYGTNETLDLGNGVWAYLPKWIPTLPDGTSVEGGVWPDIEGSATQADFDAGRDPVLEAALKMLRQ